MALYAAIAERWAKDPRAVAIEEDGRVWTRGDLLALTGRLATALVRAGARKDRPVCLIAEKSVAAFGVYLACQRAGVPFFPANAGYTDAEMDYLIGDARPSVVIADPSRVEGLKPLADRTGAAFLTLGSDGSGTLVDAASQIAEAEVEPPASSSEGDWGALLYTSGTTGKPKGAVLTQGNLLSNARTLVEAWRITEDDVLVHVLPIFHVHGLFVAGNTAMLSGMKLVWRAGFDPADVIGRLPRATLFMGVPTLYTRLLGNPGLKREAVANIRLFVSGSAPLDPATFDEFEQRTGQRILERYGMTETGMIASNPYAGERVAGSVGYPLPGIQVRLGGGEEIGVVQVKGPNTLREYLNAPEKTAEAFTEDGYFITGDLGRMDEDGRLFLVGRQSDMIISGGYNVYPSEVENVLTTHEGVLEAAVFGVKHPDWGEAVLAAVAPRPGVVLDEAALSDMCRSALAAYKRPKRIFLRPALPRNAMGKTDRKALRAQYADAFA